MHSKPEFQPKTISYPLVWHGSALFVLGVLLYWKFGVPAWRLPASQLAPCAALGGAFVLSALADQLVRFRSGWRGLVAAATATTAVYGLVFLGLVMFRNDFSRGVVLAVFGGALVAVLAPRVLSPAWSWGALGLTALAAVLAVAGYTPELTSGLIASLTPPPRTLLRSSYYNLALRAYVGPASVVHGGALARIADRYLLVTGDGKLYLFAQTSPSQAPDFTALPYRVPLNGEEFAAAAGKPWATLPGEQVGAENTGSEALAPEYFRIYGALVQEIGNSLRIFVSHAYWQAREACFVERVSMAEAQRDAFLRGAPDVAWKTLYETSPCLPVRGKDRRHGLPFVGYFGGGRIQLMDPRTILLTVGDFGFDGVASAVPAAQDSSSSYGKTIAISIADGRAETFTMGHRNPQGLAIDRESNIWSTEHGPLGGDKLNRLTRGANYGWPYATYGTDYGSFDWPLNKPESAWGAFQDPVFAWVPSIGISNLVVVEGTLFPRWRGDLLIGSLKARTLFRAHVRNDHLFYLESIVVGSRIRDLIEGHDGRILLWTDDSTLVFIAPSPPGEGETLFAEQCSGCHQSAATDGNRMGPILAGVFGRRIASLADYPDYSIALRRLQGAWTEERLDAFLKNPGLVCPGTRMDIDGVAESEKRAALISYLRKL